MRRPTLCLLVLTLATGLSAQRPEPVDDAAVEILRKHGLEQSQVGEILSWICDVHGPRLTGSPNLRRAQEWARDELTGWGLSNARLEPWGPFGRGWQLDHCPMAVIGDNPWPVLAHPKAWSPSLDGRVEAEVVQVSDLAADELAQMDLSDKIVMIESVRDVEEPFTAEAERLDAEALLAMADGRRERPRDASATRQAIRADMIENFRRARAVREAVFEKRPLAILDRSYKGDYGTVFVSSASALPGPDGERQRSSDVGADVIPQFTLAVEHYNRLSRMLAKGLQVRLAVELATTYFEDGDLMERNVVAEFPGTDPDIGDEVVMFGAHFDSWHTGTGATDNGCGSAVMMETARLLSELIRETGVAPRRTVRIALWSGEEQGLLGSRAYVSEHFGAREGRDGPLDVLPEHAKLSGYFNLDNGTGRIRGVYLQGNAAVAPIFRAWLRPFHDLDAATLTLNDTGGTDHLAFDRVGLPGFQYIQDPIAYSPRTHHSSMDNWDHAVIEDLSQAATINAAFVWHAAQRDEMLPRKPGAEPESTTIEASAPRRGS